jgi:hypothetical protein
VVSSGLAGGYGLAIEGEHDRPRRRTLYGHLSKPYVKEQDRVRQGEEHLRLDAFVAASARRQPWQQAGATLATLNRGHLPMLADVLVPTPDPDGAPPAAGLWMAKQTSSTSAVNLQAPQPLEFALQGRTSNWRSRNGKYWCTIQ